MRIFMFEFDPRRLEKLAALREAGVAPYPNGFDVTHTHQDVLDAAGERPDEELSEDTSTFSVAGRLRFKREMGKAGFAKLQDGSGILQIYVKKDLVGPEAFAEVWKKLDLGDQVWVTGTLMRTRTGEVSLKATGIALYAKCLESLPDKHHGFQDPEARRRMRYLDLFMNEDSRETFRLRSAMMSYIRRWFEDRGFMEVETPMMQSIPGGANARPFVTHHNALGIELYLRVAPELFLKRLVVGGFERVFEINRNFRNEGVSQKHNPEFTMLEFYQAHATYTHLMDATEELISGMAEALLGTTDLQFGEHEISLARPWRRASMAELVAEHTGLEDPWDVEANRRVWLERHPGDDPASLPTTPGKWFEHWFDDGIEDGLVQPTFVTQYPTEISPLSRRNDEDPRITDRFEFFIGTYEFGNGFSELNDPVDQAERFAAQARSKTDGDEEAMYFDADYVRALSYGMPPTAGEGIGIDRLVMLFANRASIRDVILFPTMRPEQASGGEHTVDDPDA
ncbi:MAG: lysine--tRNA ligase [Alphaproteobacteria bacterium]|nr:lysine--tRNA ligase [Alphaproteobacteria bacterium]